MEDLPNFTLGGVVRQIRPRKRQGTTLNTKLEKEMGSLTYEGRGTRVRKGEETKMSRKLLEGSVP